MFTVRQEIRFFKVSDEFHASKGYRDTPFAACLERYNVLTVGTLWHTGLRDLTTVTWRLGHVKVECSSRLSAHRRRIPRQMLSRGGGGGNFPPQSIK